MEYIHLAGTNGKGSTAQYIAEILGISHSCGLFTSPHIISPLERFKINGMEMTRSEYDGYMAGQREKNDGSVPELWTLFGAWTNMALEWFADKGVEYAVIETGLGGRKDQTNVIDSSMQIITPVSFDHMEQLGNSLKQIAREKCGIIKWGSTVISHPQHEEVMDVIKRTCDRLDCRLIVLDKKNISIKQSGTKGQVFSFRYGDMYLEDIRLKALAEVQVDNACVAAIAAKELGISAFEITEGIEETCIQGRIEYEDGIIIDAAHNEEAIKQLAYTVKKHFNKKHITVVTAVMEDKDVKAIAGVISSFADFIICTCADKKRGLPAKEYAMFFDNAQTMENPSYAMEYAREIRDRKKGIIVVCGSFYLLQYALGNDARSS